MFIYHKNNELVEISSESNLHDCVAVPFDGTEKDLYRVCYESGFSQNRNGDITWAAKWATQAAITYTKDAPIMFAEEWRILNFYAVEDSFCNGKALDIKIAYAALYVWLYTPQHPLLKRFNPFAMFDEVFAVDPLATVEVTSVRYGEGIIYHPAVQRHIRKKRRDKREWVEHCIEQKFNYIELLGFDPNKR